MMWKVNLKEFYRATGYASARRKQETLPLSPQINGLCFLAKYCFISESTWLWDFSHLWRSGTSSEHLTLRIQYNKNGNSTVHLRKLKPGEHEL
jgi:hypothetical protein